MNDAIALRTAQQLAVPQHAAGLAKDLQVERVLVLHTALANKAFTGRAGVERSGDKKAKARIIGLGAFADLLKYLWFDVEKDNPFADWWMLKVEQALRDALEELDVTLAQYQNLLTDQPGLEVTITGMPAPKRRRIHFVNPLAFDGARIIAKLDQLLLTTMECRAQNLMPYDDLHSLHRQASTTVVTAFSSILTYHHHEVTRQDVRQNTAAAQAAIAALGVVPAAVLDGRRRAGCAAPLRPAQSSAPVKMSLRNTVPVAAADG